MLYVCKKNCSNFKITSNLLLFFSSILNEEGLMPTDRVAFACLYLPDEKLSDYINTKWLIAKRNGDISSIYLCGASGNEAIELLQQYVDVTGKNL